jgi:hypothetical protein
VGGETGTEDENQRSKNSAHLATPSEAVAAYST